MKRKYISLIFTSFSSLQLLSSEQSPAPINPRSISLLPILGTSAIMGFGAHVWHLHSPDAADSQLMSYKAESDDLSGLIDMIGSVDTEETLGTMKFANLNKEFVTKAFAARSKARKESLEEYKRKTTTARFIPSALKSHASVERIFELSEAFDKDFHLPLCLLKLKNPRFGSDSDVEDDRGGEKEFRELTTRSEAVARTLKHCIHSLKSKYSETEDKKVGDYNARKFQKATKSFGIGLTVFGASAAGIYAFMHWLSTK